MAFEILIADDHMQMRGVLKGILKAQADWHVCAVANNGLEAVRKAAEWKPDVAILDLAMPVMDGLRATREILLTLPTVPILLYTNHYPATLEREAKKVGIRQVLSKTEPASTLIGVLQTILGEKLLRADENTA